MLARKESNGQIVRRHPSICIALPTTYMHTRTRTRTHTHKTSAAAGEKGTWAGRCMVYEVWLVNKGDLRKILTTADQRC